MKKETVSFSISFPELNVLVNSKTSFAQRDEEALAPYGYNLAKIDQIRSMNSNLLALPNDALMELNRKDLTVEKNSLIETALNQLSTIKSLVKLLVGRNSSSIANLKLHNISRLNEAKLLIRINTVISLLEKKFALHSNLSSIQPSIDELKETASKLLELLVQIDLAESERNLATSERTVLANRLYDELMQMCHVGKMAWKDVDAVKYQDFIVYESSASVTSEEEVQVERTNFSV